MLPWAFRRIRLLGPWTRAPPTTTSAAPPEGASAAAAAMVTDAAASARRNSRRSIVMTCARCALKPRRYATTHERDDNECLTVRTHSST